MHHSFISNVEGTNAERGIKQESLYLETNNNQRESEYAKVKATYDIPYVMPFLERLKRIIPNLHKNPIQIHF